MAYVVRQFQGSDWTQVRTVGGVIAADSTTLTDANIAPASAIDCTGLETIWVYVDIAVPGTATMTLEALYRDGLAVDGSRWIRQTASGGLIKTPALTSAISFELTVDGWASVFLRVDAVANSGGTTAYSIFARQGKRRRNLERRLAHG